MTSNKKCFAESLGDCDGRITREHYISKSVLEILQPSGGTMQVVGAPWIPPGEAKTVSTASMTSKILCKEHNEGLGDLDAAAAGFFGAVMDALRAGSTGDPPVSQINLKHNIRLLSLWMLKLGCGGIASGIHGGESRVVPEHLVRVLYHPGDAVEKAARDFLDLVVPDLGKLPSKEPSK